MFAIRQPEPGHRAQRRDERECWSAVRSALTTPMSQAGLLVMLHKVVGVLCEDAALNTQLLGSEIEHWR